MSCGCGSGEGQSCSFIEKPHESTKIKKIIAVVSGKGGVGKSLITSLLAVSMSQKGYKTAVMDADITGPSIPKLFGVKDRPFNGDNGFFPVKTKNGINVMSVNLLLENETDPVIWRGPVIAGVIKQFWKDVIWDEQDFMFIDMPPGTGDVPLTVFQSVPVDGIIIVTSPQELVSMIVAKAVNMAKQMNIPVLGIVENLSYVQCPDCGKKIEIFGKSSLENTAKEFGIAKYDRLPVNPEFASVCDKGEIETVKQNNLENMVNMLEELLKYSESSDKGEIGNMKIAVTYENGEVFQHFGHTEQFKIYDVENGKTVKSEVVSSGEFGHESLAGMLKNMGISVLICGGIGSGAKNALAQAEIEVYPGTSGNTDKVVEDFLAGKLNFDPDTMCSHHSHEHGEGHSCSGSGGHKCCH